MIDHVWIATGNVSSEHPPQFEYVCAHCEQTMWTSYAAAKKGVRVKLIAVPVGTQPCKERDDHAA